ncbi:MAG TPA: glycosyltransferase family 39 protein, partial [Vicinamibacterales bacterium]|nr:glycosyltransferase family 39 protein [Vicinamibacterales bacterium]
MSDRVGSAGRAAVVQPERLVPLLLAAVALAWVVVSIEPFPVGVFQDDGIYTELAKSLATGQGYRFLNLPGTPNATHFPPGYPLFLAALWKVFPAFPANVTLFKFANAALVALAAALAWRFARRRVGMSTWTAGLSVGAFTACAPIVLLGVMVMSEPLFLAALFPVLMACERAAETGRRRDAVVAGAAGGALALVRTLGIVAIPATVVALAWRRRWLAALLVCVTGAAVMLPWQLWVAAHGADLPPVLAGKYGSYWGWLMEAVRGGGIPWVAQLVVHNVGQLTAQGWATVAVDTLPAVVRWSATIVMAAFFATGWWRLLHRAPVAAWLVAMYMALVISWPFTPARFTWAIWPLVGIIFGLAIDAVLAWRPVTRPRMGARWAGVAAAALLIAGYGRYNYLGTTRDWWTHVQSSAATRAKPLAEWIMANTPEDAVIATDDDVLIHLYTGRRTIPNGTFTPQEHLKPQTPAFATEALRTILRTYDVDYVMASSEYGTYAARGLLQAQPPELQLVGALKYGVVFRPVPRSDP